MNRTRLRTTLTERDKASIRKRVQKGIVLLDEKFPEWRKVLRVMPFKFSDPCKCVLGNIGRLQCAVVLDTYHNPVTGVYQKAQTVFGIVGHARDYGFDWGGLNGYSHYVHGSGLERDYLALLWKRAFVGKPLK